MKEQNKLTQMGILNCAAKTKIADLGLKMVEKSVLLAICMHIRKDTSKGFQCNPSRELLSSEVGVEKQSITNAIKTLKKLGYIKVVEEKGTSNTFYVNAGLILEKHKIWYASFGKGLKEFPHLTQEQADIFNAVENKELNHTRNTSGLKHNKSTVQFEKMFEGVLYTSEEEYDAAVLEANCPF